MSIEIKRITSADELNIPTINKLWKNNDDLEDYDPTATTAYVQDPSNYMLVAYIDDKPVGLLLATVIKKPYKDADFLYVDEVDTHVDYCRQGTAKALMQEALNIAKELDLAEVWLGTEPENDAANKLYTSLDPDETEKFIGYTYEM